MKINIDKYNKHCNGSSLYEDHDDIILRAFNYPTRTRTDLYELFRPKKRTGSKYPSFHLFEIHCNEDGITVDVTGRDDDKTIKVWELKQRVEYVSDFYKRLYDNGFLKKEETA